MKLRYPLIALSMLLGSVTSVQAQISIGIGLPGISIGINMPVYPNLVLIPGYPVYYDPRAEANYFFYDGLYWVYQGDDWYASSWYNGPWQLTPPEYVPLFVLRVPVRYYRRPPVYFRAWRADAPPRWGDHWGRDWEQRRSGWDRWDRRAAPKAAPLPVYQRQYSGNRYPRAIEQQHTIQVQKYRYQPHDPVARQHLQQRSDQDNERARPQQQAPVSQQRPPRQQQDSQLDRQRQPMPVPPPRMQQRSQPEPQDRGRENRAERQDRAEPQGRGHEGNVEPQNRERGNKGEQQGRGRGHRIEEERDQDRR